MKLPAPPQRTTTGFVFPTVERALADSLGRRQFGQAEIRQVIAFFGDDLPCCVFCGDTAVRRWDHLIPVMAGGETVLGNMVPACQACDDSKGGTPYADWKRGRAAKSPTTRGILDVEARIARLDAYVRYFRYRHRPLDERLDDEERAQLASVREHLRRARTEAEQLIAAYARRSGQAAAAGLLAELREDLADPPFTVPGALPPEQ